VVQIQLFPDTCMIETFVNPAVARRSRWALSLANLLCGMPEKWLKRGQGAGKQRSPEDAAAKIHNLADAIRKAHDRDDAVLLTAPVCGYIFAFIAAPRNQF
jgi:hypothetical protein